MESLDEVENPDVIGSHGASDLSPWLRIYRALRSEILSDDLPSGSRLPSEKQLCDRFSVTRMTVRRALQALQQEGMLIARKGVGVFVRRTPPCYQITDGNRFIDNITAAGDTVGTTTLSIVRERVLAEPAEALKVPRGSRVIVITRLRLINNEPTFLNCKQLPAPLFPDFDAVYAKRQSVDDVYRHHGIDSYRRRETRITGGFATEEEARILGLSVGAPLLRSRSVNEDDPGTRIEYSNGCWPLTAVEFVFPGPSENIHQPNGSGVQE
ncbi:GntR family transcriptional regulator [Nitratireductor sp. XY-223]|uniref:GntR family transcriptional regulator n=1 Tax=Nitratireductor sp. XY-223 TaxID=2561926 RepID=UPI00145B1572|nr:GntR family transcriptional regulator [Nitratireductor sp. XY-223]